MWGGSDDPPGVHVVEVRAPLSLQQSLVPSSSPSATDSVQQDAHHATNTNPQLDSVEKDDSKKPGFKSRSGQTSPYKPCFGLRKSANLAHKKRTLTHGCRQSSAIWKFCRVFNPAQEGGPNVECCCPTRADDGTTIGRCGQVWLQSDSKRTFFFFAFAFMCRVNVAILQMCVCKCCYRHIYLAL